MDLGLFEGIISEIMVRGGLTIRGIISIPVLMILLCSVALAATVVSNFESHGDGTMMHYTYLKEPYLQESGYALGYKAGSFSYFNNGSVNYSDSMEYNDGLKPSDGNSSVKYTQSLSFKGDKGISEFYGKGFYPSNRALSAWKKIRYDDLSYERSFGVVHLSGASRIAGGRGPSLLRGSYGLGDSYSSREIDVNASVEMGPAKKKGYEFKYNATVVDGVLEIRDASGWTNRTGFLRVDWERDAVMRGNFTVVNDLIGENLFFPAADADRDWLSCCIGGDYSRIEHTDDDWPNRGTYSTLAPLQKLPSKDRTQNCTIVYDPKRGYIAECTNLSYEILNCTMGNCPGFEGIFDCGGITTTDRQIAESETLVGTSIRVKKWILSNESDSIKYRIDVINDGTTLLEDVNVTDVLPDGMKYLDLEGYSSGISSDDIEKQRDIICPGCDADDWEQIPLDAFEPFATHNDPFVKPRGTSEDISKKPDLNLTWNIPQIGTGSAYYIYLNVIDQSGILKNFESNWVYVEGTWKYGNETVTYGSKAQKPKVGSQ